ncbi:MAG: protein kinase, partial [Gemmatimonadetes bacterium]|nr:protein kinase [Gemmatimonadota bacterium]
MPDAPLTRIGKYEVTDLLGQGAMGVVYRALDPMLNRYVAVKVMSQGIASDPHLRDRFMREARAAGSLQHPHIITIFDFGEVEGHLYIAMEYIEGSDLSEIMERHDPLPLPAKLDIVIDVLHALDYAHGRHLVHRDIKPANIRVSADGRAKLMDFGIARLESSNLTKSGVMIGTPHYMAPEQVTSGEVSPATDIFAMGVVLYEFLTHRKTFEGDTLHAVLYKVVSEQPPPLREVMPGIPEPLQAIVDKALAKDPKERYQSAEGMAQALSAVRAALSGTATISILTRKTPLMTLRGERQKPARRRALRIGAGAGAALAVGLVAWLVATSRSGRPAAPAATEGVSAAPSAPLAAASTPDGAAPSSEPPTPATPAQRVPRVEATPARGPDTVAPRAAVPAERSADRPAAPEPRRAEATPVPPVQPAPQPAPQAAAPAAPQPAAPAAPPADPRAEIQQLVAAYARAIESRSVAEIRRVYPGLTGSQQQ